MNGYFAHSLPGRPIEEWEPLEKHLRDVADLAAEFAAKFGAVELGRVAGLWHDLGEYSRECQAKLRVANGIEAHLDKHANRVDHWTAGAQHASRSCTSQGAPVGDLIAYCIAEHHTDLADRVAEHRQSRLDCRLKRTIPDWSTAPREILQAPELQLRKLIIAAVLAEGVPNTAQRSSRYGTVIRNMEDPQDNPTAQLYHFPAPM
jgi:CRISPR-associated endonuclease Cas3-HD